MARNGKQEPDREHVQLHCQLNTKYFQLEQIQVKPRDRKQFHHTVHQNEHANKQYKIR